MARIEFDRVTKRFGVVTAVDDLSFSIDPGSITGFVGTNGAGKSTALRILLGLTRPTSAPRPRRPPLPGHTSAVPDDRSTDGPGRVPSRPHGTESLRVLARAGQISDRRVDEVLNSSI